MKENLIFKTIVGSTAYGTNIEGSDIDYKGIYLQSHRDILTFNYKPQIEVGKDECYYEGRRFLELLQTANPTVLEMLFMPDDCVEVQTKEFDLIKNQRDVFLTKNCKNSFGGYAVQQIQKAKGLNKKMNWEKEKMERKTPLDFCFFVHSNNSYPLKEQLSHLGWRQEYCGLTSINHIRDGYALFHDWQADHYGAEPLGLKGIVLEDSNSIRLSSIPKEMTCKGFVHYNKDGYASHCKDYNSYTTWLKERNTQRYVDIEGHGQQIDGKNMLHCVRLLDVAIEIAKEGTLNVRRPNGDYLRSIRKGKVDLNSLVAICEDLIVEMDELYTKCSLPNSVDPEFVNDLLAEVRGI